jgi:hypothetical protein
MIYLKSLLIVIALGLAGYGAWVVYQPAHLMGGDAYNAIIAATRGTMLVCSGILVAVLASMANGKEGP